MESGIGLNFLSKKEYELDAIYNYYMDGGFEDEE